MTNSVKSKPLHITLWLAQILLGALFLMTGTFKSTQPIAQLAPTMTWVTALPEIMVRFIGICELLGGIGLLLPSLFRIRPALTPWAAIGLATIMLFAIVFHISRNEFSLIGINITIGLIAVFIAWGRLKKAVIQPKA